MHFQEFRANPLCGRITNHVVKCGGKAILTEVSEMFGAETRTDGSGGKRRGLSGRGRAY